MSTQRFQVQAAGGREQPGQVPELIEVRLTSAGAGAIEAVVGERRLHVHIEQDAPGRGRLRRDGRVLPFRAVRDGEEVHVWIDGAVHRLRIVSATARRAGGAEAAAAPNDLEAPMPGTILWIAAVPGESFQPHQPLIVMESMKMEMTLSAPRAGTVREVLCAEGDLVQKGALLARLTSDDEAAVAP